MNSGDLGLYFRGVTAKKISDTEVYSEKHHQHEFNATTEMKKLLGEDKREFPNVTYLYLSDEAETIKSSGKMTWYNARKNKPDRSPEYRFTYAMSEVMERMKKNDSVFICVLKDDQIIVLIAEGESTIEAQLYWLFSLKPTSGKGTFKEISHDDVRITIAANEILETIGIEPAVDDNNEWLDMMLNKYGGEFPSTKEFSAFARGTIRWKTLETDNDDDILVEWLDQEEMLFRILERHMIQRRLDRGFDDVDEFIQYSLSVQNRRKSRVGYALENHFEEILKERKILYDRTPVTEKHSKPDFIFPGIREYHRPEYPEYGLTMLGVKSTCKDRWRQVLAEADRIRDKHLLTLQGSISKNQTDQMKSNHLRLVVPQSIRMTYDPYQRNEIMTVQDFLDEVREKQDKYCHGHQI